MTYKEVVAHLDALQMHKIKLGLEAMQSFLDKVGRPESKIRFVHLAGTNGKGSVCAAVSDVLGRAGYKVGVYTSPHLSSVRERFRIGKDYISEESFARIGTKICEVLGEDQITYFEFTTALGLMWFTESEVDLVLLETGMGGRLDATNVVTPLLSVITSISMDHEIYLGDSLAEIAGEKAGIIKEDVPVISTAIAPEAATVIAAKAKEKNAPLYVLRQDFDFLGKPGGYWDWVGTGQFKSVTFSDLFTANPSPVQRENQSLAIGVINLLADHGFGVSEQNIRQGLEASRWPGRMEYFEFQTACTPSNTSEEQGEKTLRFLLDGAHNPAGVKNLARALEGSYEYSNLIVIWGAMADKDISLTLGIMLPLVTTLVITQPDGERSATPDQIYELLDESGQQKALCVGEVEDALSKALQMATPDDLIVVAGSLYLIGAMRSLLLGELV